MFNWIYQLSNLRNLKQFSKQITREKIQSIKKNQNFIIKQTVWIQDPGVIDQENFGHMV